MLHGRSTRYLTIKKKGLQGSVSPYDRVADNGSLPSADKAAKRYDSQVSVLLVLLPTVNRPSIHSFIHHTPTHSAHDA